MQLMGFLPLWVGDIPNLGHVIRAEEPQASSGAILDVGTSRGVLQGSPVVSTCSSYTESSKAGSAANRQTLGTKGQRAARGQGAELLMSTAAALPAKTSSLPLRAAVLYSVCAGCCSSHSSAHIRANLACVPPSLQWDIKETQGSLGQVSCSPPIPAQKPEQTNQQQFESQNPWRTRTVPSPTALGPVFPELQVAQLSGEALCLVSGAAPAHATVGLMYFWAFLHSCCSSYIFRNADGSLQILIIFWLRLLFEC